MSRKTLVFSGACVVVAGTVAIIFALRGRSPDSVPSEPRKLERKKAADTPGLDAKDPAARLKAVRQVKSSADPDSAKVLLKMLDDPEHVVRLAAAEEIAALKDRSILNEVILRLENGPTEQREIAAVAALGLFSDAEAQKIYHLLLDQNIILRRCGVQAIPNLHDREAWKKPLADVLRDEDATVRFCAAKTVKLAFSQDWAIPIYEKIVQECAPDVQRSAIIGLGMLGSPQAAMALGRCFGLLKNDELKIDILNQLAQIKSPESRTILLAAAADPSPAVSEKAKALIQKMN